MDLNTLEVLDAAATEKLLYPTAQMLSLPTVVTSFICIKGSAKMGSKVMAVSLEKYNVPLLTAKYALLTDGKVIPLML